MIVLGRLLLPNSQINGVLREFKANGSDISLTKSNVEEYIQV